MASCPVRSSTWGRSWSTKTPSAAGRRRAIPSSSWADTGAQAQARARVGVDMYRCVSFCTIYLSAHTIYMHTLSIYLHTGVPQVAGAHAV